MNSNYILIASIAIMLVACATTDQRATPQPHTWAKAVQTADSKDAHLRLANHYDEIANTLEADAQEEKEMLDEYMARPWKFGKRIHDFKARATAMIQDLEMAARESRQMADYHRQMASDENR